MAVCIALQHIQEQGPEQPDLVDATRLHVYAITARGEDVFVVSNVTPAGAEWFTDEMTLVDDGDADQIAAYAKTLRQRAPARYFWANAKREQQRLDNLPLRGACGRFHTQGAH